MADALVTVSPPALSVAGGEFLFSLLTKLGWQSIIRAATNEEKAYMAPQLSLALLLEEAGVFAQMESDHSDPAVYGVTDGNFSFR